MVKAILNSFEKFFKAETAGGIILFISAVLALVIANSPMAAQYNHMLHLKIGPVWGSYNLSLSLLHWLNDGLMTVFFLVVGMEIKHELAEGELKTLKKALLPAGAALGGMILPAVIYLIFNIGEDSVKGWGIPMATDIAFALGALSLLGAQRAPKGLAVFLTALAIIDDLGAIIVIAVFYTASISHAALLASLILAVLLLFVNRSGSRSSVLYLALGALLWLALLKSGIHATIAGVITGLAIPAGVSEGKAPLLEKLVQTLTPWTTYMIMPLFALANAGVTINPANLKTALVSGVGLGIFFGLIIGKQAGVFGASYFLIKLKAANLPEGIKFEQLYGSSLLAGIGFTMSLFIANLAFSKGPLLEAAKISIITASLIAGLGGVIFLRSRTADNQPGNLTEKKQG